MTGYVELQAASNFSFLRSGSHPEELVSAAMHLGLSGIGIADRNSFAGVVRRGSREAVALEFGLPFRELRTVICDKAVFFLSSNLAEQIFVQFTRTLERRGVRGFAFEDGYLFEACGLG